MPRSFVVIHFNWCFLRSHLFLKQPGVFCQSNLVQQPVMPLHGNFDSIDYLQNIRYRIGFWVIYMVNHWPIKRDQRLHIWRLSREEERKSPTSTKAYQTNTFSLGKGLFSQVVYTCLKVLHLKLYECIARNASHPLVTFSRVGGLWF